MSSAKRSSSKKSKAARVASPKHVELHVFTKEQTIAMIASSVVDSVVHNINASDDVVEQHITRALDIAAVFYDRAHGGEMRFVSSLHARGHEHHDHEHHDHDNGEAHTS